VRPYSEVDDPHRPTRMEELLNAVGVPTVDYTLRTKCCGGSLTGTIPTVGVRLNYELLKEAVRNARRSDRHHLPALPVQPRRVPVADPRRNLEDRSTVPVLYIHPGARLDAGGEWKELGLNRSISGGSGAQAVDDRPEGERGLF